MINAVRKEKEEKRREKKEESRVKHRRDVAKGLEMKEGREKREREEYWRVAGRKRKDGDGDAGGVGKRRKKG